MSLPLGGDGLDFVYFRSPGKESKVVGVRKYVRWFSFWFCLKSFECLLTAFAALQDCGGGVTCTFEKVGLGITHVLCHRILVAGLAFSFCGCGHGCVATISVLWLMSLCRISHGTTSTSRILTVLC